MVGRAWVVALLCLTVANGARSQEVDGTWRVRWAQGVRVSGDGSVEVTSWGEAELRLRQVGDSVSGTWLRTVEGLGAARWQVAGTLRDDRLGLTATEGQADEPALSRELSRVQSIHWQGVLVDGHLEGEMWLVVPEMGSRSVRRPWSAERRAPG